MQSPINNEILTGSHQNTVFMSNLCKLMGQWIKISAQKYDSGINTSAVHRSFARGTKIMQKNMHWTGKRQIECKKLQSIDQHRPCWIYEASRYLQIVTQCNDNFVCQWCEKRTCSYTLNPTPSVVLTLPFLWRMFFTAWLYPGMGLKITCQMAPLVCFSPILPGLQHLSPSTPLTNKTSQNWVYWLSQTLLLCLVKNLLPFVVYFWQSHISDGYRHTL